MNEHPRGQPRQPAHQPPDAGSSPASNPHGKTPHGVPQDESDAEPTGYPQSDRHQTETAPTRGPARR